MKHLPISNREFLEALFVLPEDAAVGVARVTDLSGAWPADPWTHGQDYEVRHGQNAYFCISSHKNERPFHRTKQNFRALHHLMLDDVGTKVPRDAIRLKATYAIETSSGNFQLGFKLKEPLTDLDTVGRLDKSVLAAGLSDPAARGFATRFARLPQGWNTKRDPSWQCGLVTWRPELAYTLEELLDGLGIELAPPTPKPQAKPCNKISATLSTPYGKTALEAECKAIADAPAGQRHDQLFKSVAALGGLIAGGEVVETEARAGIMEAVGAWNTGAESEGKTLDTIEDALATGMTEPRQAPRDMQTYENKSGLSGLSGQATDDGGFVDPTSENDKSGLSGQATDSAIFPKGYAINANGLWHIAKSADPDKGDEETWLGPPLYFLARTRNSESEAWGLLLAWHDLDNVPHRWAMPYAMLNDARQAWRSELASGGWIGAPGQKAKGLLAQLLATVTVRNRARCVACTGWHGPAFVLPDAVYGQGEERLVLQASMAVDPFRQARTLEEWNATMGVWARGNRLLMFAISAALSGPLLDLAGMDSGGFHLHGKSSSGKTTLIRAAWSVWGLRSGVRTWRATSNALESISALHNDTLLCLDEIGQAPGKVVGEAAYLIANGQGKSRSQVDGSARALRSWRIPVLSNGEMTLADKMREDGQQIRAGQEVRIIDLPADAGAGLGSWQELHGHGTPGQFSDAINAASQVNYGTLGRAFLDALTRRRGELSFPQEINAVQCAWSPKDATGQVRRVVQRFALTGLAGELAVAFGLVPWAEGESLAAAKGCLESWLESRGNTDDQEDSSALERVRGFIVRYGSSCFQNIDHETPERILERKGFRRTLNGQVQFIFTKEQFKAMLGGLNATTAAKALDRAGMLYRNDGRNLTVRVPLPDLGKPRVYAVVLSDDDGGQSC